MTKIKAKKYAIVSGISVVLLFLACHQNKNTDTIVEGKTSVLVDETLLPIIEDQVAVFESQYKAKITLLPKSEKECVVDFSQDKAKIVVLSRDLNKKELAVFKQKKIVPRSTPFAIDAITLVSNKKSSDTLIALTDVVAFLQGKSSSIKGLVFDNPNSSSVRYLAELAGLNELPQKNVYSFKSNQEVIKYVAENDGMIGVVGLNWLVQPKANLKQYVDQLQILSVKAMNGKSYVYPSQESIASRDYPLARVLYIINCQGYEGLGMGFASFIAGDIGQRIIETSGLAPMRIPSVNIRIRNQIENDKK